MGMFSQLYEALTSSRAPAGKPEPVQAKSERIRRTAADEFQSRTARKHDPVGTGLASIRAKIAAESAKILEALGKPQMAAFERDLAKRREAAAVKERSISQTPEGLFISGKRRLVYGRDFRSSNPSAPAVYSVWYEPMETAFYVHFFDNSLGSEEPGPVYRYLQVPEQEARMVYRAFSKGIAVWDYFRVRGSRTAHKRGYERVSG